jgi:hypothetical protein
MWGVTTYFNPAGYSSKLQNLELFAAGVRRQGLKLFVVELAFPSNSFRVPDSLADGILRLNADSVLWQKERLLNIAFERLPPECDKVLWLDGDLVFENDDWVNQTSRLLDSHKVVQPFAYAVWLPPREQWTREPRLKDLHRMPAAAAQPGLIYRPDLAHPGFAWAARRDILTSYGVYDKLILGGGDFLIMLAMYSDASLVANPAVSPCLSDRLAADVTRWADQFHNIVRGDVAHTPGTVFHLWHGTLADRRYLERYEILRAFDFDPQTDIKLDGNGCWQWSSDKPELHRRVKEYFSIRRADRIRRCAAASANQPRTCLVPAQSRFLNDRQFTGLSPGAGARVKAFAAIGISHQRLVGLLFCLMQQSVYMPGSNTIHAHRQHLRRTRNRPHGCRQTGAF